MASKASASNVPEYHDPTNDTASIATTTVATQHDDRHETMSIASTVLPAYSQTVVEPPPEYHSRRIPPDLHFHNKIQKHSASFQYDNGDELCAVIKKSDLPIPGRPSIFIYEGSDEVAPAVASSRMLQNPLREAFCFGDHSKESDNLDWTKLTKNGEASICAFTLPPAQGGRQLAWHLEKVQLKAKGPWYFKDVGQIGPDGDAPALCTFDRSGKGAGTLKWHSEVSREEELGAIIALISLILKLKDSGYYDVGPTSLVEAVGWGLVGLLGVVSS